MASAWMLVLCGVFAPMPSHALDQGVSLYQYGHTAWRVQDGELAGAPSALAQTRDGYLWIGTNAGPIRFDGVNFSPLSTQAGLPMATEGVMSLLAGRDGSLWVGTTTGLARWHDGELARYGRLARVNKLAEDAHGDIWFSRSRMMDGLGPLGRLSGDQVSYLGKANGLDLEFGNAFAVAADGSPWVGTGKGVVRWSGQSAQLHPVAGQSSASGFGGPEALLFARDGSLWAGFATDAKELGLQHMVDGRWRQVALPGFDGSAPHIAALLFDREDTLWIGTTDRGLFRLANGRVDHFGVEDGLSGDGVAALVEDEEGDLWVGTTGGLDRFRDLHVASISTRDGLAANTVESVAASPDGSLWISDLSAIEQLRDGRVMKRLNVRDAAAGGQFNKVFVDRSGRVWAGVDDDLAVLEGDHFKRIRMADGKAVGLVVDITQDTEGAIWALPVPGLKRLVRVVDDRVAEVFTSALPYRRVMAAPDGGVWVPTTENHSLSHYQGKRFEAFAYPPLPQGENVLGLQQGPDGSVLGSSRAGLVVWRHGESRTMTVADGLPCQRLYGLAVDHRQTLWLYGACGLVQISAADFRAWWNRSDTKITLRTYDVVDGAQGGDANFGTSGTVTIDGRVWFANGTLVQMVDPERLSNNVVPPRVQIDAVVADHQRVGRGPFLRLGSNPGNIEIDYTATSLVAPQKVLFRYILEGHDRSWQEAGTRRQAFYTDLKPGHYKFRVVACNNDGLWNLQGATLDVDVPPTFVQTRWFIAVCVALASLALWGIFRFRLRQIRMRLDARISERERIARELHDTLLQGAQGLIMVLQGRLGQLTLSDQDRAMLDKAVERANDLVIEGRDRIQDLRAPPSSTWKLFESLKADAEALGVESSAFRAVLTGPDLPIEHAVKEELRRIAGEALSNAFRHSQARGITLSMDVGERALTLSIRDDGTGAVSPAARAVGVRGHWGITGMRERAKRIGARLDVVSVPGLGTEVGVSVAASRVFGVRSWRTSLATLWRSWRRDSRTRSTSA